MSELHFDPERLFRSPSPASISPECDVSASYNLDVTRRKHRLAAIDVGTNSIHMIIVEAQRRGFRVIDREKEMVQLGRGSLQGKPLTVEAIERGTAALTRMAEIAKRDDVSEIVAVATSAVREAPNGKQFIRRAEEASGIRVRVISGEEEADYIYRAVRSSVDFHGGTALCFDIGGGSVELIAGTERQVFFTRSEKLGVIRLAERFLKSDPPKPEEVEACRQHIRKVLKKPVARVRAIGFDFCIGTSGTINTLAELANEKEITGDTPTLSAGLRRLSKKKLEELIVRLLSVKSDQRVEQLGVDPKRAETIVAGALVVDELMDRAKLSSLRACSAALREGIVQRVLEEQQLTPAGSRESVRRSAVLDLLERSDSDRAHSQHVARLAVRIFDQTEALHKLTPCDREVLEDAALLHEIGVSVSFDSYHKHTYYLVRHSGLRGFTDEQVAMVATVARYHRKKPPVDDQDILEELKPSQRATARKLIAMLRIAEALDRSRRQAVRDVAVEAGNGEVRFSLRPRSEVTAELETVEKAAKFFARTFDRPVEFAVQRGE